MKSPWPSLTTLQPRQVAPAGVAFDPGGGSPRRSEKSFRAPVIGSALAALLAASVAVVNPAGLVSSSSPAVSPPVAAPASASVDEAGIASAFGDLPLAFEANAGQSDAQVDFLARGNGYNLFLTPSAATFALEGQSADAPGAALRMNIVGGDAEAVASGTDVLPGTVNYLAGGDGSGDIAEAPTFGGVTYDDVYPGIDLAYYGVGGELEYDFIVEPGVDPGIINVDFEGAEAVAIEGGELVLDTPAGEVRQSAPVLYQDIDGTRRSVEGAFTLTGETGVGFDIGAYDPSAPLVIDPVLAYSSFIGGNGGDRVVDIAVDDDGSAYVVGLTISAANFPVTPGAFQTVAPDSVDDSMLQRLNAFIAKFDPSGSTLEYATFLGGSGFDGGFEANLTVDAEGNAYIHGETSSTDFPTTAGAFQEAAPGAGTDGGDAFVTKLNPTGSSLVYSTYLGGSTGAVSGQDSARAIAVDAQGNAYVTGTTVAIDFPTTPGAFLTEAPGILNSSGDFFTDNAYVTMLNASGSDLLYSTYLGGIGGDDGDGIAVDANGSAYVTGTTHLFAGSIDFPTTPGALRSESFPGDFTDAFVTKFSPDGSTLEYSTLLGGTGRDSGSGIAVDAETGSAYIAGGTGSTDFPTTPDSYQSELEGGFGVFVTKLSPDGSTPEYSTYFEAFANVFDLAVDDMGRAYIVGNYFDFAGGVEVPTTPDAIQPDFAGGVTDAYMAVFSADGSTLDYASYLGGSGNEEAYGVAVDNRGGVYIGGVAFSTDFPTTPGAFQETLNPPPGGDGFVTKVFLPLSINDEVRTDGQRGRVSGSVDCEAGKVFLVEIVLTQGDTEVTASARARCNGEARDFSAGFVTTGGDSFVPGEAQACTTVNIADPANRAGTETTEVCQSVTIVI